MASYIRLTGPLFTGADSAILRRFNADAKQLLGDAGVEQVRLRVGRRASHPSGAFAAAVTVKDFKKGKTIMADYPQVLYGPWLEGTSTRNATTRFKGYKLFRLTKNWLRKNMMPIIQERFEQAVAELNGGRR